MNVACYVDLDDCIADGLHLTDCDNDGYCNYCGCQDGIEDPPVQRTFGSVVGLDPVLPITPHPEDLHRCKDTGEWKRRDECLFSYDGTAWWYSDERYDYEATALVKLAETLLEKLDDYVDHDDSISDVKYHVFNNDLTWREDIHDYYCGYCDDCTGHTDHQMEMICDDLRDRAETVIKRTSYSDFDYDLTSWDVGEVDDTIMINDYPLLKALHDRDELEDMLDDYDHDHEFVMHGYPAQYVSEGKYPSIDLRLISDKTYWWGHSHETMYEVYHKHVDSDD